jgi:hypothetical protein
MSELLRQEMLICCPLCFAMNKVLKKTSFEAVQEQRSRETHKQ